MRNFSVIQILREIYVMAFFDVFINLPRLISQNIWLTRNKMTKKYQEYHTILGRLVGNFMLNQIWQSYEK